MYNTYLLAFSKENEMKTIETMGKQNEKGNRQPYATQEHRTCHPQRPRKKKKKGASKVKGVKGRRRKDDRWGIDSIKSVGARRVR